MARCRVPVVGELVALVCRQPDDRWSVTWVHEELEPAGYWPTLDGAEAAVQANWGCERLAWEEYGDDWGAHIPRTPLPACETMQVGAATPS